MHIFYETRNQIYEAKLNYNDKLSEQIKILTFNERFNEYLKLDMYFGRQTGAFYWLKDVINRDERTKYIIVFPNIYMERSWLGGRVYSDRVITTTVLKGLPKMSWEGSYDAPNVQVFFDASICLGATNKQNLINSLPTLEECGHSLKLVAFL